MFSYSFIAPTMTSTERERASFFHTYKRLPIDIDRGEGVYLFDKSGKRYLDLFGGLAVNALGYAHPGVVKAIHDQSKRFIHLSNYFVTDAALELAELLRKHTGFRKVFFSNSGTEGIEGAMKIARLWGSSRGKSGIVSFTNAFHGRTYGALSIMDRVRYKAGFEPFLENCSILPYNDPSALRGKIGDATAAVFLEFIQGEGGIVPASAEFVAAIAAGQRRHGFLVVADEIQSGLGRTGRPFAFSHFDISPDIAVIAKPLGGGLPIGAILGSESVADVLDVGQHGTTFGGNPVSCAAGTVVLKEIFESGLMQRAGTEGAHFMKGLEGLRKAFPSLIKDVRGKGLMIGVELTRPCDAIVAEMLAGGVLVNCTNQNVIRIVPPLIITREQIDGALALMKGVLAKHAQ
jgi:acetylornithine/N-succinyldiaminopimelate aminotransferase